MVLEGIPSFTRLNQSIDSWQSSGTLRNARVTARLLEMRFSTPSLSLVATLWMLPRVVRATALTTTLEANERSCYYADVDGVSHSRPPAKLKY